MIDNREQVRPPSTLASVASKRAARGGVEANFLSPETKPVEPNEIERWKQTRANYLIDLNRIEGELTKLQRLHPIAQKKERPALVAQKNKVVANLRHAKAMIQKLEEERMERKAEAKVAAGVDDLSLIEEVRAMRRELADLKKIIVARILPEDWESEDDNDMSGSEAKRG